MGLFDNPWHILIVLLVLVLLFGSAKLPKAAKSMGEAMRIFKKEAQKLGDEDPQQAAKAQVAQQEAAPPQQIATGQPTAQQQMAALQQQLDALKQQTAAQPPPGTPAGAPQPETQHTKQPG
jgi:sec-independent protein translocase protein TatA